MKVHYRLRAEIITVDLTQATTFGIDAFAEDNCLIMSVIDVSLNCKAVTQLIENLNKYKVELVHLMDVVYDFYYDNC